jgi:ribonuclease III
VATYSSDAVKRVANALGYSFNNPMLLRDALTHSSFANERPPEAPTDNERLEFMGDAVLQWAISGILWDRFPNASAGELTRRRADLVCETQLAEIAREVEIGPALRLGKGEERSGGREKPRLLASALEACVAAVFLDGGTQAATELCLKLFEKLLFCEAPGARDYKSRVQELLQRRGQKPPAYRLLGSQGPDHARRFQVAIVIDEQERTYGQGRSKLEAEQAAAQNLLSELEQSQPP